MKNIHTNTHKTTNKKKGNCSENKLNLTKKK